MEQTRGKADRKKSQKILQFTSNYGLAVFLGILVVTFCALLPDTFPTAFNVRTLLNTQSIILLLALAEMIPLSTENFDLSIGYNIGFVHIVTISLLNGTNLPWGVVVLIVLIMGVVYGFLNGTLVSRVGVHAFIATLASGTILYGLGFWITGGAQILGKNLPQGFLKLGLYVSGIPISIFVVLVVGTFLWIMYEYLPLGRYFYALGSNTRAAELVGIPRVKFVTLTFISSSFIATIAGVILASQLRVAQISTGPSYLLPAFTAAFLGATCIRPGRMNVGGTVIAVLLIAVAVSGLQQMGAEFFVEPMFNGSMLILAVSFSIYTARKRIEASVTLDSTENNATVSEAETDE
jgi:ribose transport system permease protein